MLRYVSLILTWKINAAGVKFQKCSVMYSVVVFTSTYEVEVVSSSWLTDGEDGTVCMWPPYTKPSTIMWAVCDHELSDVDS